MKQHTTERLRKKVIETIMDRAMAISEGCKEQCCDFEIMISDQYTDTLILRWLTIDISNVDMLYQCYRYECFDMDGTPQYCSIHYSNQQEANEFFKGLVPLYTQQYAIDHKTR